MSLPILHRFWDIARWWSKIANMNRSHVYLAPRKWWPRWISPRFSAPENWSTWDIIRRCLRDPTFSHLGTVPACDGQDTDGRTDRHTTTSYTALAVAKRRAVIKQVSAATDRPARRSASCPPYCTQMSMVSVINWWPRPSPVYHTDRPT